MKILFICCVLSITILSCKKTNGNLVYASKEDVINIDFENHLDNEAIIWDNIIDSLKCICLETNDNSLIHEMTQLIVNNDRIFIRDLYLGGGIIIFDINGKFIKRLPKGNGPGEINRVVNMAYDKWNEELIVIQNPILHRYTKNGEYIGDYTIPFPMDNLYITENSYIFSKIKGHYCPDIENFDNYSIIVTDKNYNIRKTMFPYLSERSNNYLIGYNDEIKIATNDNDTIYTYKNDSLYVSYIMNNPRKANLKDLTFEQYLDYIKNTKPFTKCFLGNYTETTTHQFFEFEYGLYPYCIFRYKDNGNINSGLAYTYNAENLFCIKSPITTYNDWFVSTDIPSNFVKNKIKNNKFINKDDLSKLEALKEDDNIFIVMYKLKPFEN